jgi:hypothetical protein
MPPNIQQALADLRAVCAAASNDKGLMPLAARASLLTHEIEKAYGG